MDVKWRKPDWWVCDKKQSWKSWEEIYWHKRRVEEQQEVAVDLTNDDGTSVVFSYILTIT